MTLKDYISQGDKFGAFVGVQLIGVKDGVAQSQLEVKEHHLNAGGVCQGGAIFTLADVALAAVSNSGMQLTLAIDSSIFYHRSAMLGDILTAEAVAVSRHPKVPYCEVRVKNQDGVLIASFQATCYSKRVVLEGVDGLE